MIIRTLSTRSVYDDVKEEIFQKSREKRLALDRKKRYNLAGEWSSTTREVFIKKRKYVQF